MTIELKMLALSVVLGLIQIVLASHAGNLQLGYRWTASPRDEMPPPLTVVGLTVPYEISWRRFRSSRRL